MNYSPSDQNITIFQEERIVYPDFALCAQIADHVPVEGGLIDAAGLGIAIAQSEMDGAAHLLVEERIACGARHLFVVAKGELA